MRAWPRAEHGGEPLPARHNATVGDGAVLRFDRQLTLALVQIQAYDLHDGWPPLAQTAALLVVALVARWIPARRAANIDPIEAIRHE